VPANSSGAPGGAAAGAKRGKFASSKIAKYSMSHPVKAGLMGAGALATAKFVTSGRRGKGVSKTAGRPTGMYKY
jgi:hypothetical protein